MDGVPGRIRTCDAVIRRTALRCLWCRSDAPKSLSINEFGVACVYAVALEIPVPWLRGDAVVTDTLREACDGWRDFVNESERGPQSRYGYIGVNSPDLVKFPVVLGLPRIDSPLY